MVYDDAAARLVRGWKEEGRRGIAEVAARLIAEIVPRPAGLALVSVPADAERRLVRGHAPPRQLAAALGERWNLPVVDALDRAGSGQRQRGLSRDERRRNVRDVYVARAAVSGPVVVVDDVFTTGETTGACARVLRRAGASRVEVVTFARRLR
ncbi:MAG: ComF family protein [Gaiella sp.]